MTGAGAGLRFIIIFLGLSAFSASAEKYTHIGQLAQSIGTIPGADGASRDSSVRLAAEELLLKLASPRSEEARSVANLSCHGSENARACTYITKRVFELATAERSSGVRTRASHLLRAWWVTPGAFPFKRYKEVVVYASLESLWTRRPLLHTSEEARQWDVYKAALSRREYRVHDVMSDLKLPTRDEVFRYLLEAEGLTNATWDALITMSVSTRETWRGERAASQAVLDTHGIFDMDSDDENEDAGPPIAMFLKLRALSVALAEGLGRTDLIRLQVLEALDVLDRYLTRAQSGWVTEFEYGEVVRAVFESVLWLSLKQNDPSVRARANATLKSLVAVATYEDAEFYLTWALDRVTLQDSSESLEGLRVALMATRARAPSVWDKAYAENKPESVLHQLEQQADRITQVRALIRALLDDPAATAEHPNYRWVETVRILYPVVFRAASAEELLATGSDPAAVPANREMFKKIGNAFWSQAFDESHGLSAAEAQEHHRILVTAYVTREQPLQTELIRLALERFQEAHVDAFTDAVLWLTSYAGEVRVSDEAQSPIVEAGKLWHEPGRLSRIISLLEMVDLSRVKFNVRGLEERTKAFLHTLVRLIVQRIRTTVFQGDDIQTMDARIERLIVTFFDRFEGFSSDSALLTFFQRPAIQDVMTLGEGDALGVRARGLFRLLLDRASKRVAVGASADKWPRYARAIAAFVNQQLETASKQARPPGVTGVAGVPDVINVWGVTPPVQWYGAIQLVGELGASLDRISRLPYDALSKLYGMGTHPELDAKVLWALEQLDPHKKKPRPPVRSSAATRAATGGSMNMWTACTLRLTPEHLTNDALISPRPDLRSRKE